MAVVGTAGVLPDYPKLLEAAVGVRSYEVGYLVLVNNLNDEQRTVCGAPGIPRIFSPYVFGNARDQYCLCRSLRAERIHPNSFYWHVFATFKTPDKVEVQGQNDNPLLELPEIETTLEKFQEVIYAVYDIKTKKLTPCKNSAGQVFDPPPMRDSSRLVLTITRNEAITVLHPSVDVQYTDAVNEDVFWGCPPGTWKCQGISTRRETRQLSTGGRLPYLKCTYKFEARPTWDLRLLDAGNYYVDRDIGLGTEKKFHFTGDDGQPINGLLDGFGAALPVGANPVFIFFRPYLRYPFSPLNLPQSFAQVA